MISLQDAVTGDGFVARITLSGRTLIKLEDDGKWWMYGVQPAGIAASGSNIDEAFLRFRTGYKEILSDIAQESRDFAAFRDEVERFFSEPDVDDEDARLWDYSLETVRSANCQLPAPFSGLPRQTPESHPFSIEIERVDTESRNQHFVPNIADNYFYSVPKAA